MIFLSHKLSITDPYAPFYTAFGNTHTLFSPIFKALALVWSVGTTSKHTVTPERAVFSRGLRLIKFGNQTFKREIVE